MRIRFAPAGCLFALANAASGLFGVFGVAGVSVGEPDGVRGILDAVPKSAAGGDFVLPLLEAGAVEVAVAKGAFEGMLAGVAVAGVDGDPLPGNAGVRSGDGADLFPAFDRVAGGVPEIPSSRRRRRSDPFPAFRHQVVGALT